MSATSLLVQVIHRVTEGEHHWDDKGYTTHHWLWPEKAELIYGTIASLLVFAMLFKFGKAPIAKMMAARTNRIAEDLDGARDARAAAQAEADRIRSAIGDIGAERDRILAEADANAERLLAEGRQRLDQEAAELEAKAESDIAAAASRSGDNLRAEISRLSSQASEQVVVNSLDDATQQRLIEDFIARVGATTGANA